MLSAALVTAVVVLLFMRLIVEKNRYAISLYKALGFTGTDLKRIYFINGLFPVIAGLFVGFFAGNLFGKHLCGTGVSAGSWCSASRRGEQKSGGRKG